jgi:hypothetical protein
VTRCGSGRLVRDQLVLVVVDHVLDAQLALLQALELNLVGARKSGKARDGSVEVTMLGAQLNQAAGDKRGIQGLGIRG